MKMCYLQHHMMSSHSNSKVDFRKKEFPSTMTSPSSGSSSLWWNPWSLSKCSSGSSEDPCHYLTTNCKRSCSHRKCAAGNDTWCHSIAWSGNQMFGDRSWTLQGGWQNFICNGFDYTLIIFFRQPELPEDYDHWNIANKISLAWRRLSEYNWNVANKTLPTTVKCPRSIAKHCIRDDQQMFGDRSSG